MTARQPSKYATTEPGDTVRHKTAGWSGQVLDQWQAANGAPVIQVRLADGTVTNCRPGELETPRGNLWRHVLYLTGDLFGRPNL